MREPAAEAPLASAAGAGELSSPGSSEERIEGVGQFESWYFRDALGRPGTSENGALSVFPEGRLLGFRARGRSATPWNDVPWDFFAPAKKVERRCEERRWAVAGRSRRWARLWVSRPRASCGEQGGGARHPVRLRRGPDPHRRAARPRLDPGAFGAGAALRAAGAHDFEPGRPPRPCRLWRRQSALGLCRRGVENIEAAVTAIVEAGAIPVTMGGDRAVTLPRVPALPSPSSRSRRVAHRRAYRHLPR